MPGIGPIHKHPARAEDHAVLRPSCLWEVFYGEAELSLPIGQAGPKTRAEMP